MPLPVATVRRGANESTEHEGHAARENPT